MLVPKAEVTQQNSPLFLQNLQIFFCFARWQCNPTWGTLDQKSFCVNTVLYFGRHNFFKHIQIQINCRKLTPTCIYMFERACMCVSKRKNEKKTDSGRTKNQRGTV